MAWSPWLHNACYGKPPFCTGTLFFNRGFVCLWVVFLAVVLVSFAFVLVVLSYVSAVMFWASLVLHAPSGVFIVIVAYSFESITLSRFDSFSPENLLEQLSLIHI